MVINHRAKSQNVHQCPPLREATGVNTPGDTLMPPEGFTLIVSFMEQKLETMAHREG